MKKFIIFFVTLCAILFSFSFANALTDQERQNLIIQIRGQILQLQIQLQSILQNQNQSQNQVNGIWCYDFNKNIAIGDSGIEVSNLQKVLVDQGFLTSNYTNGGFDIATYDAVVAFQEKYKSEVLSPAKLKFGTGKVGAFTRAKLNKIYNCTQLSKCAPSWSCSEWSLCKNDKQTRKCSDSKNCKILLGKPKETQSCSLPSVILKGNNIENKTTINAGEAIEISWAGVNVTSCSASGNWTGSKNISGSETFTNLTSSRIYNISCVDSLGKVVTDFLTVDVSLLSVDIKADKSDKPISIDLGKSAQLSWESTGAKSCSASGDWLGIKTLDGSESTGYLYIPKRYIYTINCSGASGNTNDFVEVNVLNPFVNIKANNSDSSIEIISGKTVKLTWESSGLTSCTALGNWSGGKEISGSESMGNITSSKFYVLECIDYLGNKVSNTVSVNIK
ncbi:MAG: hypothetical protein A2312_04870 [Candidatus Staskawiczbacteria bacterium RIFOXYB2_FULL_32_9]|nr:MAG: hypothetical protein A2312_04870 [Candidatus Staskawiczbacteria bacterium RIFOXYB2_FULL_32_9]